ncbi:MAG: hypothetical protein HY959_13090 [Ignavibacteriae bacterium]|nr:hypothetical protein [Ignavibacteriota bacterium]
MVYEINKNIENLKCIWMSTNDVGEKLCDRKFDCDNCEFDRQMRKSRSPGNIKEFYLNPDYNLLEETIQKLNSINLVSYPPNYRFNKSFMLKKFLGETYFLGFNPVLNVLFDSIKSAEISGPKTVFRKGDMVFDVKGDWGNIVIHTPFDFSFESDIIPLDTGSGNNWIGFVKSSEEKINPACMSREQYAKSIDSVCRYLKKYMEKSVTVGTTLYDGGERLKYIYQIIGKENYRKILMVVLS